MADPFKQNIPPEAAAIMKAMVRMPPKPHEEMKLGKSKVKGETKASQSPKGTTNPASR